MFKMLAAVQSRAGSQCTGALSRYKKNEVFLDVVESVNLLVNSNGTVVRSEVVGALKMRTFLSGMPECKLGLNDKVGAHTTISAVHAAGSLTSGLIDAQHVWSQSFSAVSSPRSVFTLRYSS